VTGQSRKVVICPRTIPMFTALPRTAANSNSVPQPRLLNHIQNPKARATGGFLQVAVSEAPLRDHRDRLPVVMRAPQIQH
jgi:hypothetical protein